MRSPRSAWAPPGVLLLVRASSATRGQTTAFTYQGQLTDAGAAADGNYDLPFALFDGVTTGQCAPCELDMHVDGGDIEAAMDAIFEEP